MLIRSRVSKHRSRDRGNLSCRMPCRFVGLTLHPRTISRPCLDSINRDFRNHSNRRSGSCPNMANAGLGGLRRHRGTECRSAASGEWNHRTLGPGRQWKTPPPAREGGVNVMRRAETAQSRLCGRDYAAAITAAACRRCPGRTSSCRAGFRHPEPRPRRRRGRRSACRSGR